MKQNVRDAIFMLLGIIVTFVLIAVAIPAIFIFGVIFLLSIFARLKNIE